MKKKDLQSLSSKELTDKMNDLRLELIKQGSQMSSGAGSKSPGQVRELKKTIARIKTILKTKEAQIKA